MTVTGIALFAVAFATLVMSIVYFGSMLGFFSALVTIVFGVASVLLFSLRT